MEYHRKTGDANFLFSEFSIVSFFPITLPRFHFNMYAWLHLKHLCLDIYASLVFPTSHLCVVLHFLILHFRYLELVHPVWHRANFNTRWLYISFGINWAYGIIFNGAYIIPISMVTVSLSVFIRVVRHSCTTGKKYN